MQTEKITAGSPLEKLVKSIQTFGSLSLNIECRDKLYRYNDALMQSLYSILEDQEHDADGKMQYLETSLDQYVAAMKDLFPKLLSTEPPRQECAVNLVGKADPNRFDEIHEIEKANPWHGPDGKFTSGPGGAAGGVASRTITGGGISYHVKSGKEPKSGYMCAVYTDRSQWLKGDEVKDFDKRTSAIKSFMEKNKDVLSDPDNDLGTWFDTETGAISLDISRNFKDKNAAIKFASEHNEKAIWDVANMAEISTGGTGNNI